jgi:hypothetical protein
MLGLWVRSYTWCDHVQGIDGVILGSSCGVVGFGWNPNSSIDRWRCDSYRLTWIEYGRANEFSGRYWLEDYRLGDAFPGSQDVIVPHWWLIAAAAILTFTPWIRWSKRYSLRTFLIITTALALILGLIIYTTR